MKCIKQQQDEELFEVYTVVGLPKEYPRSDVLLILEVSQQTPIYYGQHKGQGIAPYHFGSGSRSTLKNMKQKHLAVLHLGSRTFTSAEDMFRFEAAMIVRSNYKEHNFNIGTFVTHRNGLLHIGMVCYTFCRILKS